ncbi:MFS general substrate transporter [Pseudovirgaria hyperparasitica]|uniref:MFS general substrate transporter n=1 Tax=Pseudovirgaria hyperparasitica TaxID=470096 RepID=A0A6A6W0N8_9PEZI|nr:MFS general substrate transporter [Pseudovirgaria hyperparasitica]KAF2756462.1 MFS general substrate transporter [Pseudovirgaria hyperparasitica]
MRAERALTDQMKILPKSQLYAVTSILSIAMLATYMDQNGVSVTVPIIGTSLGAEDTISWAGTSSLVANTVFSALYGRMSDIWGRKRVFISALVVLSFADVMCGLSQNGPMLYFFRGVAGAAGGGVTNLTMMILSDVCTLEQRGTFQGIIGSMVGIGNVIGPFIAAAFLSTNVNKEESRLGVGWRAYFYFLAPLVAAAAVVSGILLPNLQKENKKLDHKSCEKKVLTAWENVQMFDWGGLVLSAASIILILIPISGGGAYFPWNGPVVISFLVIGSVLLVALILYEWKVARLPMIPVTLFSNTAIAVVLAQCFLIGFVYQTYIYYLPLYFQNVRQFSPIVSAALICPIVVMQATFSVATGRYISYRKRYGEVIIVGFILFTLGAGLTVLFDVDTSPVAIVFTLGCVGIGVGCVFQPTLIALQAHSPKPNRAVAVSMRNFFRCLGGAIGLAASAAVLQATLRKNLPEEFSSYADHTYSLSGAGKEVSPENFARIRHGYMLSSRAVFIVQVPLMFLCLLGCWFVKDRGLERPDEREERERRERSQQTMNRLSIRSSEDSYKLIRLPYKTKRAKHSSI